MRNLIEVVDRLLEVIPLSEERLRLVLKDRQDSATYTSPETMGLRWTEVACVLEDEFVVDDKEPVFEPGSWQQKVFDIWMAKV